MTRRGKGLFATALLGLLLLAGCNTPLGTVAVKDDAGQKIGLAWDKSPLDGVADRDPVTGEVDYVLPKQVYEVAEQIDEIAPMLLKGAGSLLGISWLTLLGVLWKKRKLTRCGVGVVESVQVGRQAMADGGFGNVLTVFDKAIGGAQTGETRKMVTKIKKKELIPNVAEKPE